MTDQDPRSVHARLRDFRAEVGAVSFDATGQVGKRSYRYVTLQGLLDTVTPVLTKHGLILHQAVTTEGVYTMVTDDKGYNGLESTVPINYAGMNSQEIGSAITYARRYGAFTLLGLVADEDDDGAAASGKATPVQRVAPASEPEVEPEPGVGWNSAKESADAHFALSDRIGKLDAAQRSICSQYRDGHGGWPLPKKNFDELSAIVSTMEAGLLDAAMKDEGKF